jgi:hypothetical protein
MLECPTTGAASRSHHPGWLELSACQDLAGYTQKEGKDAWHDPEPEASSESHIKWLKSMINEQGNLT